MEKEILREKINVKSLYYAITVLAVFCAGLLVYVGIDFKSDLAKKNYYDNLNETEMKNAAYFLLDNIENGDRINAYHNAKTAAEYAKKAGLTEQAQMFDDITRTLSDGNLTRAEDEILSLRSLMDGEAAFGDGETMDKSENNIGAGESDGLYIPPEEEAHPVYNKLDILNQWKKNKKKLNQTSSGGEYIPRSVRNTAEENIKKLLGVQKLNKELSVVNGNILYTCKNAYAALSTSSAQPLEFALSLPKKPPVLGDEECVRAAHKFVSDFFPVVRAESDFAGIFYEDGDVRVNYVSSGSRITVLVERGAGRIVGLAVA